MRMYVRITEVSQFLSGDTPGWFYSLATLAEGPSISALLAFWAGYLLYGTFLCIAACIAAPLASTH